MSESENASLFVLATKLYVHFRFKTRTGFSPQAALADDDYAREILAQVRAVPDARLQEMADRFEAARFPTGPMLDLPLDSPA